MSPAATTRSAPGVSLAWLRLSGSFGTALALLGLLCIGAHAAAAAGAEISKEYQLKAAFLFNFTKYVEWSPQHFKAKDSPIVIGVLGHNPFGEEMGNILLDRTVNGRALVVKIIGDPGEA